MTDTRTRRVAHQVYETLDGQRRVQPNWTQGRSGNPVQRGWLVMVPDGRGGWEYGNDFLTKADALDAIEDAAARQVDSPAYTPLD